MIKIGLTGGPCSGKSTCLSKLQTTLASRGYKVFVIPETATEIMTGGIHIDEKINPVDFQKTILKLQIEKEKIYSFAASFYPTDKTVMICDRTILDGMAYTPKKEFKKILKEQDYTISSAYGCYDAVFHLTTAAKEAPEFYVWNDPDGKTNTNNKVRWETPEQAINKDDELKKIFIGHPHFRVIRGYTDFNDKISKLLEEVYSLLGNPVPSEIERKFLIKMPETSFFDNLKYFSKSEIVQTYLKNNGNIERRLRQRGTETSGYTLYYTEKSAVKDGKRLETEKIISEKEYISLLAEINNSLKPIRKTRYCFLYKRQFFELDIYPDNNDYAVLEIELISENEEVTLPPDLKVIKEITDEPKFFNQKIAEFGFPTDI